LVIISVTSDIDAVAARVFGELRKQIPFGAALGITRTAQDVQRAETQAINDVFDRPTNFTLNAVGYTAATKATLTATVFIKPIQAGYLKWQEVGGTRYPQGRALVLPTPSSNLDAYGNLRRGVVKQYLARPDTFSGTFRGTAGIWLRQGKHLRLLIQYEPKATYEPIWDFVGIAERVVAARIEANVSAAMEQAIATATQF